MKMRKRSQGFTLIEVLIAILIISIGALGFTKSQFSALQTASDAALRTTATVMVEDMVARIEANAGDSLQGLNSGYQTGPATLNTDCLSSTGTFCQGNAMALHDLADWNNLIANYFPADSGAIGIVCLDQNPGNAANACSPPSANPNPIVFTVKILWNSWQNRGTSIYDQSVVATVEPPLQR